MLLSQCSHLCCHFLFRFVAMEEGGPPSPGAALPSLELPWSRMGQFVSSTFLEGSPARVWSEKLCDGEHTGAGEAVSVHQDQVMCPGDGGSDRQAMCVGSWVARWGQGGQEASAVWL